MFTVDIDCESCAARIMNNVPVIGKGIKDIQVDVPSKEATVTYDSAKTSPEELIKGFGKIRIKIGRRSGRETTASPEYEDCKRAAMEHGAPLRRVYDTALAAYHAGQAVSDGNLPDSTT